MSTSLSSYEVVAQTMPPILAKENFSLHIKDQIVAQIKLTTTDGKTGRGIHIGSTINEINKAYGSGQVENDSGEQWVSYGLGKELLSFEVKDNKVVKVAMYYENGTSE